MRKYLLHPMRGLKLTLRKIKYGSSLLPIKLTAKAIVNNDLLLADVTRTIWGKLLTAEDIVTNAF